VAGYEVSLRLASAINPAHYRLWHTTGTVGAFGAAAAAARTLTLDPGQTAGALGLAGTQAAGLWEVLPDAPQAKNLHPAKAAHAGFLAALLSQKGIEGPVTIFEGPQGFFSAMVPEPVDAQKCTAGLGEAWLILTTTFKNYPVCGHTMTPIEAALKLHGQFAPAAVETIEVEAHPVSLQVAGQPAPSDEYQAKFSIPYCVAVALLKGRVGQEEFSCQVRESREIHELLKRIRLIPEARSDGIPGRRSARITVRVDGGKVFRASADVRKGDPEWPMTAREKRDKFLKLTGQVWGDDAAEGLFDAIQDLPRVENVLRWAEGLRSLVER